MYKLLDIVGLAFAQAKLAEVKEANESSFSNNASATDLFSGESLKAIFASWIVEYGSAIVLDETKDSLMIPRLLKFYQTMVSIVRDSFDGSEAFTQALKESFACFMNKRQTKPSEFMAMYIDRVLKKGKVPNNLRNCSR